MKQIKGKAEAISRYGGIKIGDKWYNPVNEQGKEKILNNKDKIKNNEIILLLDDKGKINGYSFDDDSEPAKDYETVKSYQEQQKRKSDDITLLALMKIGATIFTVVHDKMTYDQLMTKIIKHYKNLKTNFRG